jgi:hypothetical protein
MNPTSPARKFVDRVIRTHTRHGFTGRLPDGEYEKAIASAERIAKKSVNERAA